MNSNPEPIDNKQFLEMLDNYFTNFPATSHEIYDLMARGDKVIAMFAARAIHDVDSYGVPATGRELLWKAIAVFQVSDGKIQTRWEVADILSMYQQLGMELKPKEGE
jgi:predicted ester cyclase